MRVKAYGKTLMKLTPGTVDYADYYNVDRAIDMYDNDITIKE
jgi:hypothetical protein